ncbi:MAG: hypothetical protein KF746_01345 [Chitinophagaceae bacterium]|nr:hypothetical protein [Chitinophagaceae bacterium]
MKKSALKSCVIISTVLLLSCNGGLKGTYNGSEGSFFDKLVFTSGSKVEVYYMGTAQETTYERDGDKVKIAGSGGSMVFKLDDTGCLTAEGLAGGQYCKE